MTKEEARRVIDAIAREAGVAYVLFETREAAEEFMREMRAAHAMKMRMDALGISMPEGMLL